MKLFHGKIMGRALLLVAAFLAVNACSRNPVTGKKELMLVSENQEKTMGLQYDPQIVASYGLYEDQKMQDFINEKGKQMGKISHRPSLEYNFRILDSPVVNAFAVPGGYVYFTRGIMAHFNNEAEFAGVLGHEIGHVTARHSAKQQTNQILGQVGLMGGLVLSKDIRNNAEQVQQALGLMFLKFGRDDESQSDQLGVEYSTKIGYDATYMANFFKTLNRISEQAGQRLPTFLSTHPDPLDRYAKVTEAAKSWQAKVGTSSLQVNRNQFLRMIDGIIYGTDPKQGFVENWNFYHPEMKFQFPVPRNWQYENTPQQFAMAPSDGKAMMALTLAQGKTLQEAAQNTTQQLQLTVRQSSNTKVNGLNAMVLVSDQVQSQQNAQGQTQQQTAARILTYLIEYNGVIFAMHGMALPADFNNYAPTFESSMQGFKSLSDPDKLNRKPERVRVKTVTRTGTVRDALLGFGVADKRLEEMAILNSMQLTDQITSGTLIKVVEY
jgi:predicted Zn-dependent protease